MKRFGKVFLITLLAVSMVLGMAGSAGAVSTTRVYLGVADSFAILSGAGVTDAGAASIINVGDVGATPITGASIVLTTSQLLSGSIYSVDGFGPAGSIVDPDLLTSAWNALTAAYLDADGRTPDITFVAGDNQLGGQTLIPGVYRIPAATTANLIGTLTLDAAGDPDPVWIFQSTSTLVIAADSEVVFANTGTPCDVFWQVDSSATIGERTNFIGNIMADQAIGMLDGATLDGSAQARIASVTLINNEITKNPCALAPPVTPVTPGLPYTGLDGVSRVLPWNIVGIAVTILAIGLIAVFAVVKTKREKKETS